MVRRLLETFTVRHHPTVLMRPVYDANNEKQRGYIKFYKMLFPFLNNSRSLSVGVVYYFSS